MQYAQYGQQPAQQLPYTAPPPLYDPLQYDYAHPQQQQQQQQQAQAQSFQAQYGPAGYAYPQQQQQYEAAQYPTYGPPTYPQPYGAAAAPYGGGYDPVSYAQQYGSIMQQYDPNYPVSFQGGLEAVQPYGPEGGQDAGAAADPAGVASTAGAAKEDDGSVIRQLSGQQAVRPGYGECGAAMNAHVVCPRGAHGIVEGCAGCRQMWGGMGEACMQRLLLCGGGPCRWVGG